MKKLQKKETLPPLTPPDLKQCQALIPNGFTFMTFGGVPGLVRCREVPITIATELAPASDGRTGSMSLCANCWAKLIEQSGAYFASFAPIINPKKGK